MVPKYTRPEMGAVWSTHHTYDLWLKVEVAVAEAWHRAGEIPEWAVARIRSATFDESEIERYEEEVQHDVIAFLRSVNQGLDEAGRFVHLGLTSNDVKDTALSLQIWEAVDLIQQGLVSLREKIAELATEHRDTLMMGRTHGVHAEPITFGMKLAVWYADLGRAGDHLRIVADQLRIAKISGAVGTHSNVPVSIEEEAARLLGLEISPAETQVVQRDRHARLVAELAVLASILDKMATEIRNLQRTEVGEVQEPFSEKQAGSSAMPHKRNPILSERVSGLARLIRGYAVPALENVVLWSERDISNSSVERVMLPDVCIAIDYMLHTFGRVMGGLKVLPEKMRENLEASYGVVFSQRLLKALLDAGLPRDDAYRMVQRVALTAFDQRVQFKDLCTSDPDVASHLSSDVIDQIFDYGHFVRNIDVTFRRAGLAP